jgi:hypothetical protein
MKSEISTAIATTPAIIPPMSHQLMTVGGGGGGRAGLTVKVPNRPSIILKMCLRAAKV